MGLVRPGMLLLLLSLAGAGLGRPAAPGRQTSSTPERRFEFASFEMGTLFRVVVYAPGETEAAAAAEGAFRRVRELDLLLSDYRADSELNRACRGAFAAPQVVSRELFDVLSRAQHFSRLSGGAFDVTVGPLVRLWRTARTAGRLPSSSDLASARERSGFRRLLLNPLAQSIRLQRDHMQLDLGGIAKGFAADQALAVMKEMGFERALVDAGGDVRCGGSPSGLAGWTISLETGRGPLGLVLSKCAVATSGDRHQLLEIGGRRYSHIIDPRTGMALTDHRQVTVIAPDALTADALATALSVLRPEEGMELVRRIPGVSARIEFLSTGESLSSPGFPP